MGSEPKKPIEQMLEMLAKARRAEFGDDPKMPNPMRARLHEEIARTGAVDKEDVEPRESWLARFWPRVTVAAALATLIVLIPAIWWNLSHPLAERSEVALRDHTAAAFDQRNMGVPSENTLAKAPAVSATEATVNLADNSQIKIEPAARSSSESEVSKSSTHVAQGRAASDFTDQSAKDFADKKIAAAKIQAAPAAAPASGADLKAKSDGTAAAPPVAQPSLAGNLPMAQQFSQQSTLQSFRNNRQVNRAANVLNTFQVQQQGDEIRVLDADGSTYTGKIEQSSKSAELDSRATERRDSAKQTRAYAARAARENESAAAQSYFRATGYNVSLQKTLVFEGNYAAPLMQQPATAASNDSRQVEQSYDRARIVGTVRVNGEAPVEVDAIAETSEAAAPKKSEN